MKIEKVRNLKAGQIFRTENGRYRIEREYWPEARNPCYRSAQITCIERFVPHRFYGMTPTAEMVSFNCNTKVILE